MRQTRGRVNAKNKVFSLLYPLNWGCRPMIYLFTFIVKSVNNLRKRPHEYMELNIESSARGRVQNFELSLNCNHIFNRSSNVKDWLG
jgi:hypothetical protein